MASPTRDVTAAAAPPSDRSRFWLSVLLTWAFMSALSLYAARAAIAAGHPAGPDDLLRLVEVRDWLAGQAWTDVSQHRIGVPGTLSMHWSRLVDLPIAGIVQLVSPFAGSNAAERAALIAVPLLTSLATLVAGSCLVRRFARDRTAVLLAPLFLAATPLAAIQTWPMRIDHHGWQIAASVSAVAALFGRRRFRAGACAGFAMAAGLAIAIEGLPLALIIGAVLACRALLDRGECARLTAYTAALGSGTLGFFAITQPPAMWNAVWCDALMPPYIAALCAAALVLMVLHMSPVRTPVHRLLVMVAAAGAGGGTLLFVNPACAAGPFASLDPLVMEVWYKSVAEGRPLWHASDALQLTIGAQLLIGAAGYGFAIRHAHRRARRDWTAMAVIFAGAALIGIAVMRASGTATIFALPGTVYLLSLLLPRAAAVRPPWRVFTLAAVITLLLPLSPLIAHSALVPREAEDNGPPFSNRPRSIPADCGQPPALSGLASLPPSTILAPLDMAPALLYASPHRVVASAHHRGNAAMADTIRAFLGSGDEAVRIAKDRGFRYLAFCPSMNEVERYAKRAPDGLAGRLTRGEVPDWLRPVPLPGPVELYEFSR